VVAGCGNPLFGDDGFGPAVIEKLRNFPLPSNVKVLDAGTSGPDLVFPLLDLTITRTLIIVDIIDFGGLPGSIARIHLTDLPGDAIGDAIPGGLIQSLFRMRDQVEITIFGCQPFDVSYPEFRLGLSREVAEAIPEVIREIIYQISNNQEIPSLYIHEVPGYSSRLSAYDSHISW
jgi:coenzyme F420 hydrogenase subunit delta